MEQEQPKRRERMSPDANEGVWCILIASGSKFIARLQDFKKLDDKTRENVRGVIKNNSGLKVDVLYDYFSPIRQVPIQGPNGSMVMGPNGQPQMGIGRETIVTSFEWTMSPVTSEIFGVTAITFLDDMEGTDQNRGRQIIDDTIKNLMRRRAAASGIALPEGPGPEMPIPVAPGTMPKFKTDLRHGG